MPRPNSAAAVSAAADSVAGDSVAGDSVAADSVAVDSADNVIFAGHFAGDITFEDIARTFGFSSFLRYVTVTGAEFRQLMEAGFRGDGTSQGYFPQISGFRVCVDRSRESGARIMSLQVPGDDGWSEIEPESEYTLVLPDFLYRGGDGYRLPEDRQGSRTGAELKYLVLDAILRAQGAGQSVGVPVDPKAPRIELHAGPNARCFAG